MLGSPALINSPLHQFTDNETGEIVTMRQYPGDLWREVHRSPTRLKRILDKLRIARDKGMDAVRKGALDL